MNYYIKYSPLEDLRRIKCGYMPKNHFMFLYNTIPIFIVLKRLVYLSFKDFMSGIISFGDLHKKCQVQKPKTKNVNITDIKLIAR